MSVQFNVIAVKFPISVSEENIKEMLTKYDKLIYNEKYITKDAEHITLWQKGKFRKLTPTDMMQIVPNEDFYLVIHKTQNTLQLTKMKTRGGGDRGRPKQGETRIRKPIETPVCESCQK